MNDRHESREIVTRFPPSPTGKLHIGGARTALFNFLFARKHQGKFLLRSEDTDRVRSKKEFEDNIINELHWLGLTFDDFCRQSDRTKIYVAHIKKLIEEDRAYISTEADKEGMEREVVRFRNPNKQLTFNDLVRGDITYDTTELGDFIIARSTNDPLYHLAVVIDDFKTGVTHIIRGDDGISNTPRQILLQDAIGAPRPIYVHLPLVLGSDKSKLSKRDGGVSVSDFREMGYLPEALVNTLVRLGWSTQGDEEFFSLDELIDKFDIMRIHKGGAVFNKKKLDWYNKHYLLSLPPEKIKSAVLPFLPDTIQKLPEFSIERLHTAFPHIIERNIPTLAALRSAAEEGLINFYFDMPIYETKTLLWKGDDSCERTRTRLLSVRKLADDMSDIDYQTAEDIKKKILPFAESEGRGEVLWPLRVALSGLPQSPDPFTLMSIFKKQGTLERIDAACEQLIRT